MANLGVAELRQLQEENARLKRAVADLTLDKQILSEVIRKKARRRHDDAKSPTGSTSGSRRA